MKRYSIFLIGAGGIGARHLESLMRAKTPFTITVIDPSQKALANARRVLRSKRHCVSFVHEMPKVERVDVAIVATTSRHRASAVRELLTKTKRLRYLVLEKVLFDRKKDYFAIGNLLKKHGVKTWVNHPRRLYPFHRTLPRAIGKPFQYHAQLGVRNGLMTNILHYADYFCFLAGSTDFTTDTSLLSPNIVESKRKGFKELYGTIVLRFREGSLGMVTALPQEMPLTATVISPRLRAELDESAGGAFVSEKQKRWKWKKVVAPLLLQSEMTGPLVDQILRTGRCDLPDYKTAARVHLQVLEPVRRFLSLYSYPFT